MKGSLSTYAYRAAAITIAIAIAVSGVPVVYAHDHASSDSAAVVNTGGGPATLSDHLEEGHRGDPSPSYGFHLHETTSIAALIGILPITPPVSRPAELFAELDDIFEELFGARPLRPPTA